MKTTHQNQRVEETTKQMKEYHNNQTVEEILTCSHEQLISSQGIMKYHTHIYIYIYSMTHQIDKKYKSKLWKSKEETNEQFREQKEQNQSHVYICIGDYHIRETRLCNKIKVAVNNLPFPAKNLCNLTCIYM